MTALAPILSTHVLDLTHGCPAEGVAIRLLRDGLVLAQGVTDRDGRCPALAAVPLTSGRHALIFSVAAYFRGKGVALADPPFLDVVTIDFGLAAAGHYHVPLLVSPFGYSTYRGS